MLRIGCFVGVSAVALEVRQPWMDEAKASEAQSESGFWTPRVHEDAPAAKLTTGNKYIYNLVPDNGMMCIQGPKGYLTSALERLRSSPMGPHYAGARVTLGMCTDQTYANGPFPGTCFPRAAIYTDDNPLHILDMLDFDQTEARLFAEARNVQYDEALSTLKSACDDGTMETGLQLSLEESQAQVYVPPMSSLIPDNKMGCIQGTMSYLQEVLKKVKTTKSGQLFKEVERPIRGMCSEHGYTVGAGSVVGAGHGRVKSKCFPKATLFWDRDPDHHQLLMWSETQAQKGPNRDFVWANFMENQDKVREMCGGKQDTIFPPMIPPNIL